LGLPEKETEDGEGTNVDAGSGDCAENSTDESGENQDQTLPNAEILDRIESLAFVLSAKFKKYNQHFN
jgi:hypothetical protein